MYICFGELRFDRRARILFRNGDVVPLLPGALEFLGILLDRRPETVARPELERLIWHDAHVPDNGLSKIAFTVRRALGDQDRCACIRTVYGFGYAFIGKAREETDNSSPRLGSFRALVKGREIALVEGENWIGRANECHIQVASSLVSRRHACIMVRGTHLTLRDGPSRNGTFLNHKLVTGPVGLRHRDQVRLGSQDVRIEIIHADRPTDRPGVAGDRDGARASAHPLEERTEPIPIAERSDG